MTALPHGQPPSVGVGDRRETIFVRILGPLRVTRGGAEVDVGPRQQRSLLAFLLAREGEPCSINELIELLWGSNPPPTAVNVIHKYVGLLRRLLEPGLPPRAPGAYLARHGNWYRFTAGPEMLDLVQFRRLVAQAKECARRGALEQALDRYTEALRLCHGPAGQGLADTPAAQGVLAGLDGEFFDAVVAAGEIGVQLRRSAPLLAPLQRAAEMDPLNEVVQASLVTALAASGRQATALMAYGLIRTRLADELGIMPGPDLREAHQRVLAQAIPSRSPVAAERLSPDLASSAGRREEPTVMSLPVGPFGYRTERERPRRGLPQENSVVEEIIELCGRLQMALATLAAGLAETGANGAKPERLG